MFYPASEKRRHVTGLAFVHIGVARSGRLSLVAISRSSGVQALDQAALETVRAANPLPPLPERMHASRVDVELPIFFGDPDKNLKPSPGNCAP
jgi:periplasmic protein TonB